MQIAHGYTKEFVDQIDVLQQQMVSVEVRFAAMSVNTLRKLGFDFSFFGRGFQVATSGPNSTSSFNFTPGVGLDLITGLPIREAFNLFFAAPNADFASVLSLLSGTRLAQILAEPTLVVRSGESAEFLAGGEIPVPVPQQQGAIGIEYRRFGIQLRLAATVLRPDRIVLRISPEVSDLDFARGVTIGGAQLPAIAKRGATTTLELGNGQSFILAGLMSSSSSEDEQKIPYLGDIPVLGAFFKRVNNSRERQELVIVATPRLVQSVDAARLPPPPGADMRSYDPSVGALLFNVNPLDRRLPDHGLMP
jgi:pilus assembly protein CpaC